MVLRVSTHCSLISTAAVVEAFKNELKGFSTSKGTIPSSRTSHRRLHLLRNLHRAGHAEREQETALTGLSSRPIRPFEYC